MTYMDRAGFTALLELQALQIELATIGAHSRSPGSESLAPWLRQGSQGLIYEKCLLLTSKASSMRLAKARHSLGGAGSSEPREQTTR